MNLAWASMEIPDSRAFVFDYRTLKYSIES